MLIKASSTISHQSTFRRSGFSRELAPLLKNSAIVAPDYKAIIPSKKKMSDVVKQSITCCLDCLEQTGLKQPDAIIVGTSGGCCVNTRIFLDKIISSNGRLVSPTSFILSPHNSLAGQISLYIGNRGYNITHTQNSLSFEQALMDAMLCIEEGYTNVLVGGADEMERALYNLRARLCVDDLVEATGASFFILSSDESPLSSVNVMDVGTYRLVDNLPDVITTFLKKNELSVEDVDLILYSHSNPTTTDSLKSIFNQKKLFNYQIVCGTWLTNSAFAMSYGADILLHGNYPLADEGNIKKILICNNLIPENLGLILMENKNG